MEAGNMIVLLAVSVSLVAATQSKNFDRQHIHDLTGITEKLYIKQRDYNETENRCHSAQKQSGSGHNFIYTLRVDLGGQKQNLAAYNTSFITSTTTDHHEDNAATYKFGPRTTRRRSEN
uniref:Putative conserved secreted protein n=1 Tax=Amblyomma tuberculatum TaxID=48802 RepID=A0A6M2E2G0_9ACAR